MNGRETYSSVTWREGQGSGNDLKADRSLGPPPLGIGQIYGSTAMLGDCCAIMTFPRACCADYPL